MKIKMLAKSENALLKRTEWHFSVEEANVPPSRKELREKIAALENVKPEQVIVSEIRHGFGSKAVEVTARIYSSVSDLEKTELPYMVGRNIGMKKKKSPEAAQPPEAAKPKGEKKPAEKKKEGA